MNGRPEAAGEQPAPAPEPAEETMRGAGADGPADQHDRAPEEPVASELDDPTGAVAPAAGLRAAPDMAVGEMGPGDEAVPALGADASLPGDGSGEPSDAGAQASAGSTPAESAESGGDEVFPYDQAAPASHVPDATGIQGDATDAEDAGPDPALLAEGVRIAEALIFASDRPVTPAILANVLPEGLSPALVAAALGTACEGRGVVLTEVAGGWAFRTAPDLAQRLTKVVQAPRRLPRAAMEALSVIAYHQPCTRGEIEEIRGASLAQTTLEALLELGLIAPRGRREVPGRPTLWGTTPKFLEQFGLKALSDLPRKEELVTAETGPALPLPSVAAHPGLVRAATETPPTAVGEAAETDEAADAPDAAGEPPGTENPGDESDAVASDSLSGAAP